MDGTGQGCAIAVLDGPSVGTFFPRRAAKLPLAVFGSFAALMFRPLGCLCVHCQEATFALFHMRVREGFWTQTQDLNQVPINFHLIGTDRAIQVFKLFGF